MSRPAPDPAYLALTGQSSRPSRSKAGPQEPETSGRPKIPKYIKADADAFWEWRRITSLLAARSTLTSSDGPLIELHCSLYARLRRCLDEIRDRGQFETTVDGDRVETAASKLATKLSLQLRATQVAMGMTPTHRSKAGRTAPDPREAPPTPGSLRDLLQRAAAAIPEEPEEEVDIDSLGVTENIPEVV